MLAVIYKIRLQKSLVTKDRFPYMKVGSIHKEINYMCTLCVYFIYFHHIKRSIEVSSF